MFWEAYRVLQALLATQTEALTYVREPSFPLRGVYVVAEQAAWDAMKKVKRVWKRVGAELAPRDELVFPGMQGGASRVPVAVVSVE